MRLEKDDAKIGLMVFLTLALFVGFIFQRSVSTIFRRVTLVRVRLENAADVTVGTEVQLQGLRVGQVDTVGLERDGVQYHFLATLGLRTDILLWEGTKVLVVSKPLGGAYLDLELPPPAARLEVLRPGTILPASASPSMTSLVDDLTALVDNLNQGVVEVRGEFKKKGAGVILDHPGVAKVMASLDASLQSVRGLADDSRKLVQQGGGTVKALDRTLDTLQQSLAQVQTLLTDRRSDLDSIVEHLAGTLKEVEGLTQEIRGVLQQAGPDADESLKSLDRTLRSTEELLELLKEKPNRVVWGTPTPAEQRAAKDKVEAARKAQGAKP
ncbi:MAG: MlaD family protein [Holophaga sp.]|jgi:ABC-type transporter Mla subunit MlaD